ncbi:MAG TPA: YdhR family protein [Casimicrobiaceae bacterium]|nr:YdhR family protein [Casimicrobiaceae bacterium]
MITVIAQFKLPQPMTRAQAREVFLSTAPRYKGLPGLIRKYCILSEDGGTAGGVYLWQSRADAERMYTDEWKRFVREKYGADPVLAYLETPVVVDNVAQQILTEA